MFLSDEGADGPSSPKAAALPPTLKRALPEKEAQLGLQPMGSANRSTQDGELAPLLTWMASCLLPHLTSSSVSLLAKPDSAHRPLLRTNSEDHGPLKAKNQTPNSAKEKATGKKSSDSGEEADKDFILI